MNDSLTPPASGGGNGKYAVIGLLLLLGGGVGIYALTRPAPPPAPRPAPVVHDAGPPIVTTSTVGVHIELPPEVPDAGPPPDVSTAPRIRYVTRYVSACPGTLTDPGGVQRTAQNNFGAMRACYERELRANPTLRGRLTAELRVNTSGRLDGVTVHTSMSSPSMVNCVKAALQRLTYPPSRGGCAIAEVNYNFAPRE